MKKFAPKQVIKKHIESVRCPVCGCQNNSVDLEYNENKCYNCQFLLVEVD